MREGYHRDARPRLHWLRENVEVLIGHHIDLQAREDQVGQAITEHLSLQMLQMNYDQLCLRCGRHCSPRWSPRPLGSMRNYPHS
jgi:hypothetical protein